MPVEIIERFRCVLALGKGEVESSILSGSTSFPDRIRYLRYNEPLPIRQLAAERSMKTAQRAVENPWSDVRVPFLSPAIAEIAAESLPKP